MEKIAVWPIAVYTGFLATLWVFLVREDHSQLPKETKKCSVGAVVNFGGIGMSASSQHRESTDSLS